MRFTIIALLLLCVGCGDSDEIIRKKAYKSLHVDKDYATALKLYSKLANKGDESSQFQLGYMYIDGLGVEKDEKEGVVWWSKAAEQGNVAALNNVANAYKYGKSGVLQDYAEAIKWYGKCATHSLCLVEFGEMYELGLGMPVNYAEAVKLYQLGANQVIKNPEMQQMESNQKVSAEIHLAQMYARGFGVPKNCAEAIKWMTLAANSNSDGNASWAKSNLNENFCSNDVEPANDAGMDIRGNQL